MSDLRDCLTRSDKRAYGRLIQGYEFHHGEKFRFLTLTLPPGFCEAVQENRFTSFVKWIRKTFGEFEYFRVKTYEGNGVYHLITANRVFLPRDELIEAWEKRTGAWNVGITLVVREDDCLPGKILQEMIRQSHVQRYSYSSGWLRPGTSDYYHKCYRAFYSKKKRYEYFQRWARTGVDELPGVRVYND